MKARMSVPTPHRRNRNSTKVSSSPATGAADGQSPSTAEPHREPNKRAEAQRLLAILRGGGDARAAKIRRVRRSVRQSCYENQLKLSVALDRMLRELGA